MDIAFDKNSIKLRYDAKGDIIVSIWLLGMSGKPRVHADGVGAMLLLTANCSDMTNKRQSWYKLILIKM